MTAKYSLLSQPYNIVGRQRTDDIFTQQYLSLIQQEFCIRQVQKFHDVTLSPQHFHKWLGAEANSQALWLAFQASYRRRAWPSSGMNEECEDLIVLQVQCQGTELTQKLKFLILAALYRYTIYRPAVEPHFLAYFKKAISYKDIFNINHSFIYTKSAVLKALCISPCLSPILMDTDILSVRKFLVEFLIAIQIKTSYEWGNCTRNRRSVLLTISSPLAALGDCRTASIRLHTTHPPDYKGEICKIGSASQAS